MKVFLTQIRAECVEDGTMKLYAGPKITAINWHDAEEICRVHLPFCKVYGQASLEITAGECGWDWENTIDYNKQEFN